MFSLCPDCGLSYFPEQGYYVGAMIINYAATTACVVTIFLFSLLFSDFTKLSTNTKILLWMVFAIVLSLSLVRHAYSFWLGLDFWIKPRQPDAATKEAI
jgi:Ca2+/H+ antiporter